MMSNTPFFSVIVPVYNKEPHIKRSFNSVLSQAFQDFELIVVCDPSSDDSDVEVAKFKDSRIRVFQRDKAGAGGYAARNLGVKKAKSNWLVFLDADDEWMPKHLENLSILIDKFKKDSIFSSGWRVLEGGVSLIDKFSLANLNKPYVKMGLIEYVTYEVQGARPIWTSVVCIKKDLLESAGRFPEGEISMGGDVDTWIRCVNLAGGCVWSNHIGAIYHRDSINMVTRNSIISPEVHLLTAATLLNKSKSRALSRLIKVRTNNLVVTAWNNNMRIGCVKNFKLLDKFFFTVRPVKVFSYALFSLLPFYIQRRVHKIGDIIMDKLRKT